MKKIRVLVVDDSFFMRKVISDILNSDPEIEVVGQASDGLQALERIRELNPDVVALDLEMPKMGGLGTLKGIMEKDPHPTVIMVSGYTPESSEVTLECLGAGAVDCVLKPSGPLSLDIGRIEQELISKIKAAAKVEITKVKKLRDRAREVTDRVVKKSWVRKGIVVIGASTGGPAALEILLPKFPYNFSLPILIVQHLPAKFTRSFAQRLDKICQLGAKEGEDKEEVTLGMIYLAPGDADMEVVRNKQDEVVLSVEKNKKETLTPSIDKLMQSAADVYKENTIGIILTGMGDDGLAGIKAIKSAGGKTLVQDEATSVVYGMGKEVVEKGLADEVLPLEDIVKKIAEVVHG